MNAIVIEHVPVAELPEAWQAKLAMVEGATVTVTVTVTVSIEPEVRAAVPAAAVLTDDPAFGIWRDREDMNDVGADVRKLREPRYSRDGSRNTP